jgi:hypothetical protein
MHEEDGKTGQNGLPNMLQLAVITSLADGYDPNLPIPITQFMVKLLDGIGRLPGYKESYSQYSS